MLIRLITTCNVIDWEIYSHNSLFYDFLLSEFIVNDDYERDFDNCGSEKMNSFCNNCVNRT